MTEQTPSSATASAPSSPATDVSHAGVSPLAEADPASLEELFARIDGHIKQRTLGSASAQQTLDRVIAELRRQREAWAKAEASGAKKAPKAAAAGAKVKTTLSDLGLID